MKNQHLVISFFLILFLGCATPKEERPNAEFALTDTYRTFPFPDDFGRADLYFQPIADQYFFLFDYGS